MTTLSLDVCNEESVRNARSEVEKLVGERGLDILVNNAYVLSFYPIYLNHFVPRGKITELT